MFLPVPAVPQVVPRLRPIGYSNFNITATADSRYLSTWRTASFSPKQTLFLLAYWPANCERLSPAATRLS